MSTEREHAGKRKSRSPHAARGVMISAAICLSAVVMFAGWVVSLGALPLAAAREVSTTIVDRHGKLLRAYAMSTGRWRLPVRAAREVDPTYLKLLLAYEDHRFGSHAGVDPLALGRAALQLVTRHHIVSGGFDHHDAIGPPD